MKIIETIDEYKKFLDMIEGHHESAQYRELEKEFLLYFPDMKPSISTNGEEQYCWEYVTCFRLFLFGYIQEESNQIDAELWGKYKKVGDKSLVSLDIGFGYVENYILEEMREFLDR